ncbi:hypothetical protein K9K85_00585 [Patescibacteria group bacterium]|nr:hypothetical protein [Patescibacteria group bacterium]
MVKLTFHINRHNKNMAASFLGLVFVFLFLVLIGGAISFFSSSFSEEREEGETEKVDFWLHSSSPCRVGEKCTFFVFLRNSESCDLLSVEAALSFPSSFSLDSQLEGYQRDAMGNYVWSWEKIEKNSLEEIKIEGVFSGETDLNPSIKGSLYFNLEGLSADFSDNFIDSLQVNPLDLEISLKPLSFTYNWGEVLGFVLSYKNGSLEEVKDLGIKIFLDQQYYFALNDLDQNFWHYYLTPEYQTSLPELKYRQGSDLVSRGWDARLIQDWETLSLDEEGVIIFHLPLISVKKAQENFFTKAEAGIKALAYGKVKDFEGVLTKSSKVSLKIGTDLNLQALLGYYDKEEQKLISGESPLLRIGEKVFYQVFWNLENGSNSVEEVKVKTKLPPSVEWSERNENLGASLSYNKTTREIIWRVENMNAYQGVRAEDLTGINFEVAIIPLPEQAGERIALTEDIFLTGRDQFTDRPLLQQINALETEVVPLP